MHMPVECVAKLTPGYKIALTAHFELLVGVHLLCTAHLFLYVYKKSILFIFVFNF
jgi:hypothetical protein